MAIFKGDWHPAPHRVGWPRTFNKPPSDRIVISPQKAFPAIAALLAALSLAAPARATMISNSTAVFAALDKVTGRVSPLEIRMGQTITFGALKVTARACYTSPPTEDPETAAFIEVDELLLDGSAKRIFTGWTFAESPGLHAVEHPTFDVWLTSCKMPAPDTLGGRRPYSPRP
jgi:hypothetical protein